MDQGRKGGERATTGCQVPAFPPCYFKKREAMQVVPQPRQGRPRAEEAWARHM